MGWALWALPGALAVLTGGCLFAGYMGFKGALTRRKYKGASSRIQGTPDPNARLRADMEEAGAAWFMAQNPEEVELTARDGITLRGYFLPAKRPSDKLVVCAHGYSYNGPDQFGALLPFYHDEMNYHILLPDHRTHGRSDGKYIGFGALEWKDIFDWTSMFMQRLGEDTKVVLHGISMGGATVMNCNANAPPDYIKCVIEDCGYTNGYEMIALVTRRDMHVRFKPLVWGLGFWYRVLMGCSLRRDDDPCGRAARFKLPTLFIHGETDPFVPLEMGLRCYEAATVPKELLVIEGAGHAMAYFVGKEEYDAAMRAFLSKWMEESLWP